MLTITRSLPVLARRKRRYRVGWPLNTALLLVTLLFGLIMVPYPPVSVRAGQEVAGRKGRPLFRQTGQRSCVRPRPVQTPESLREPDRHATSLVQLLTY